MLCFVDLHVGLVGEDLAFTLALVDVVCVVDLHVGLVGVIIDLHVGFAVACSWICICRLCVDDLQVGLVVACSCDL